MPGNSPLASTLSLAQRFAFKPTEAVSASSTPFASKRRKLAHHDTTVRCAGELIAVQSSTSISTQSGDEGTSISLASSSTSVHKSDKGDKDQDGSMKRKLAFDSGISELGSLPNEVARILSDSLSDASYTGAGGSLSERQLLRLECETLHPSWLDALKRELRSDYFLKLKRFLWTEGVKSVQDTSKTIFPPASDIYSWSRFTPLPEVRVVILGQDPYHNDGLCFSVRSSVKVPPSLKNIYKEIKTDFPEFTSPSHGYLASWARQGVLLLNTCLTVRAHQANSHSRRGWEEFTDSVLKTIDARPGPGVVFLAWGLPSQKRMKGINPEKHLILSSAHPSPLSARTGFFGNAHFRRANEWLKEKYGPLAGVNWCKLEPDLDLKASKEGDVDVW